MPLTFQKAAVRKNYETGNQAFSIRLKFLTTRLGVVSGTCGKGFAAASLMTLGLVPLQAIDHPSLGYAQCEPILHVLLQRDVELGSQLLWFFGDLLPARKLHLKGKNSPTGGLCSPRVRHKQTSHLATCPLPKSNWPSGSSTSSTISWFTRRMRSSSDFLMVDKAGNTRVSVAIEVLSVSCIWLKRNWQLWE